ncbi:uncharacterized protein TNCV_2639411 [Trichonephila clavipes]|nr:uncharacterized protein TNCV_2639411 [Trichonephila clavipes]
MSTRTTFYNQYRKHANDRISCPQCRESMTVKHFYRQHASEQHNLDVRKQCVFCFGRHDWDHGQKNRPDHINHVVSCLKRFARDTKDYWAYLDQDDEDIGVEEENHVCECRHFQSIPRDMQGRPRVGEGFYESLLEKPDLWEEGLTFHDASGLGNDVWGILRRYLRGEWVWFHIMVKHDVFETFRREMERIRDQCVLLPFWCLCDGLERGKIQHRHMILACEPDCAFEEIWKEKVRYDFPNSGRAKKCVKIKNAFHLVRTIVYVSQPKSSCDRGEIPDNLMNLVNRSHFHINRPLHPHSIATLCTLFSGGMETLLWEQLGNKNVSSWEMVARRVPDAWHNLRWGVPIRVMGWKFLNCWRPFHPRWEETNEWSEGYVTLYGKKKVHLKEGNHGTECLFQRIRDEMYVLSRKQQNVMREMKRVKQRWDMDQRVLFKSKLNEMKAINEKIQMEQENEWNIKEIEWKAEMEVLKIKLENVLVENKTWETKAQEWKVEKEELKTENRSLKNKLQSRVAVDKVLKRMIRSNRKLRRINSFRFKRPRPVIVHAS